MPRKPRHRWSKHRLDAIIGSVRNSDKVPVSGATITAVTADGGIIRATLSGSDGVSKMAFSITADIGCEYGDGVTCSNGPNKENFFGMMGYDRTWFHNDLYAVTFGGGSNATTGQCDVGDWFPDFRTREVIWGAGVMVKF
jgi:hypothetical protein